MLERNEEGNKNERKDEKKERVTHAREGSDIKLPFHTTPKVIIKRS